jgi:hypothetical protein
VDVAGPNNKDDGIFQHVYTYRDSRHFQHIPIPTVEFSNTFLHEYRNFPIYFFTLCGILQHFSTYIEESPLCWFLASHEFYFRSLLLPIQQQPKQNHDLETVPVQYLIYYLEHTIKIVIFCLLFKIKSMTLALFSSSKLKFYEAICIAGIWIFLI